MTNPSSPRHSLPYLSSGQAQKELTHNEALTLVDAGLHAAAASIGMNAPPGAPEPGACWIVGSAPTGGWAGQANALACWTGSGWRFLAAREGMRVWLADQQLWAVRQAGGWTTGEVRGAKLLIGGTQVVGPRLAAIGTPEGGAAIDAEARAAIDTIIARLIGHGLIAP